MIERIANTIERNTLHADKLAGATEALALALVTRAAAWLACIPTILLTSRTISSIFSTGQVEALVSSIALEVVGQSVVSTWLAAREWNAAKRKSDPKANAGLALAATVTYFLSDFALVGALTLPKAMSDPVHYVALLFPLAQVVSTLMTGERAAQFRRVAGVEADKAQRAQQRKARRAQQDAQRVHKSSAQQDAQEDAQRVHNEDAQHAQNDVLSSVNEARSAQKQAAMDAMLVQFARDPRAQITDVADAVGVHRNTVYNYLRELEDAGKVKRNGGGVEVLA